MTDSLKCLGQSFPAGGTLTDLYTVPVSTQTKVLSLIACNQSSAAVRVHAALAVGALADEAKQYIVRDCSLMPYESKQILPDALSMAATDVLRVQSTGSVSFNASGIEVT